MEEGRPVGEASVKREEREVEVEEEEGKQGKGNREMLLARLCLRLMVVWGEARSWSASHRGGTGLDAKRRSTLHSERVPQDFSRVTRGGRARL